MNKQKSKEILDDGEGSLEQAPIIVDANRLKPGVEVVVRNTGAEVHAVAGDEMAETASVHEAHHEVAAPLDQRNKQPAETEVVEEAEEVAEEQDEVEEDAEATAKKKKKKKKKRSKKKPKGDWETIKGAKQKVSDNLYGPEKAALIGGTAAALPAMYYGTGLSQAALSTTAAGLGALALPVLGYYEGKKAGRPVQGAATGTAVGAGMYWLAGGTLKALGTTLGSVALPAGLTYAGYRIGKHYKKPVVGALAGAGAGVIAAPMVSGALAGATSGGGLTALTGALGATASTGGIALGVGGAAAGLYGLGYLNKRLNKLTWKPNNTLGTMAEGLLLPISAAWAGGEQLVKGIGNSWKSWQEARQKKATEASRIAQEKAAREKAVREQIAEESGWNEIV